MSVVYSPESQCHGKVQHPNKKLAKVAIKETEAKWGTRLNAYHCQHCGWYHTGHKVQKTMKKIAQQQGEEDVQDLVHTG